MAGKSDSVARKIAIVCAIEAVMIVCVLIGALAPSVRNSIQTAAATVSLMTDSWRAVAGLSPVEHIEPLRPDLSNDLAPDFSRMSRGVTFIVGLFDDRLTARLVDEKGALIHEWPVDFFDLKDDKLYRFDALIHGAHLYPNGDVLITLEQKGLYRVDACGRVLWRNEDGPHHSIDVDDNGDIWTPLTVAEYAEPRLFGRPFGLDRIGRFDAETGALVETIDLVDVIINSGEEGLVAGEHSASHDVLHVNDVEILDERFAAAFPMFSAGDILVSARQRNAIFVIDRATRTIKWARTGATQLQHDPDFGADGRISIFDNRGSEPAGPGNGWLGRRGGSRIIAIRPGDFAFESLYQSRGDDIFYTPRRGKHERLENGNLLIVETDAGRVFETTPSGDIVWQYVNRYDEANVGWVMSATRHAAEYAAIGSACGKP